MTGSLQVSKTLLIAFFACALQVGCAQINGSGPGVNSTSLSSDSATSANSDLSAGVPGIADCNGMDAVSCATYKATNAQRVAHGLSALQFCSACYQMASEHSEDMSSKGYFSVDSPSATFAEIGAQYGLSGIAGDVAETNLGDAAVTQWMSQPADSANILNPSFHSFAVGTYGAFSTQVFSVEPGI